MGLALGFRIVVVSLLALLIVGCPSSSDVYNLGEWRDVLKQNGKWHVVMIPDSKLVPGSIVKITKEDGLSWIDSLHSCGVPVDQLVAKPIGPGNESALVVLGASPSISFKKRIEFSAEAVLNISGVTAGPEFSKVNKVALTIGENGGDALRLIRLRDWIRDNAASFHQSCLEELAKKDRYLVAESFRISSATYSFYDGTGAKLKLTLPQFGTIVQLEPSMKFELTGEGDLRIDQPMYVAVRQAVSTAGGFETLGTPGADVAAGDTLLEEHNLTLP